MAQLEEKIILETVKRLKRNDLSFRIKDYLKSKQLSETEIELYLNAAKQRVNEKKLITLPIIKKLMFGFCVSIAFITLVLYLFVLPSFGFRQTTIIAIIGAIVLSISIVFSIAYYKSWTEENLKLTLENKKKGSFDFSVIFVLVPIPAVILTFIFSLILESGENNLLINTQVASEGTILSTYSRTISTLKGDINYSSVTVEFFTETGERVEATEDISEYEYKKFYKGQKVNLIYSSEDNKNIDLLTHRSDIIKFTGSEEREFTATDLIEIINESDTSRVLDLLNHVTYGWKFDSTQNEWENSSKNMLFTKNENRITLFMGLMSMYRFPEQFLELGFKDVKEGPIKHAMIQKQRVLENNEYIILVERTQVIDGAPYYLTTLEKK
ncbi:MAG: hypothetical protein AB8B74_06310 [Crocinitomicaceae bacterium]